MAQSFKKKNLVQKKFRNLFHNFKLIFFLGFFAIAIGATTILTQQEQDIRQNAYFNWGDTSPYSNSRTSFPNVAVTVIPRENNTPVGNPPTAIPTRSGLPVGNPPTAIPNIRDRKVCNSGEFVGGTYCISRISCYDEYCNSSGTSTYRRLYSGSNCSHCNGYAVPSPTPSQLCTPETFIGGTYCTSSTSCYDKYCNSQGTAYVYRNYSGSTCSHCAQ